METRRLTAAKSSIVEIMRGKFIKKTGFESSYVISQSARRLSRVRVLGLIVDKFVSPDGKYASITIDDGTDTIRCKTFINVKTFDNLNQGDIVDVIGKIKEYNGEIYIRPEINRKMGDVNFETLRKLELEKINKEQTGKLRKIEELKKSITDVEEFKKKAKEFMSDDDLEAVIELQENQGNNGEAVSSEDIKRKILTIIESSESGIEYPSLIEKSKLPENKVDQVVQSLLEDGVCFEPKPGKIKKL